MATGEKTNNTEYEYLGDYRGVSYYYNSSEDRYYTDDSIGNKIKLNDEQAGRVLRLQMKGFLNSNSTNSPQLKESPVINTILKTTDSKGETETRNVKQGDILIDKQTNERYKFLKTIDGVAYFESLQNNYATYKKMSPEAEGKLRSATFDEIKTLKYNKVYNNIGTTFVLPATSSLVNYTTNSKNDTVIDLKKTQNNVQASSDDKSNSNTQSSSEDGSYIGNSESEEKTNGVPTEDQIAEGDKTLKYSTNIGTYYNPGLYNPKKDGPIMGAEEAPDNKNDGPMNSSEQGSSWTFTADSEIQKELATNLNKSAEQYEKNINILFNHITELGNHWQGEDYNAFKTGTEGYQNALNDVKAFMEMYGNHMGKLSAGTENLAAELVEIIKNCSKN